MSTEEPNDTELPPLELTINVDTGAALRALRGAGLAMGALNSRAIARAAEVDRENNHAMAHGQLLGLSVDDTEDLIADVLQAAGKRWTWNLSTSEIYQEARRGLSARANRLPFLPFQQDVESLLEMGEQPPG